MNPRKLEAIRQRSEVPELVTVESVAQLRQDIKDLLEDATLLTFNPLTATGERFRTWEEDIDSTHGLPFSIGINFNDRGQGICGSGTVSVGVENRMEAALKVIGWVMPWVLADNQTLVKKLAASQAAMAEIQERIGALLQADGKSS